MFDDPFFFQPQYFERKQADVEQINKKVSKKFIVLKNPAPEGFVYLFFIYT